jgi:hypothetical protein
MTGESVELEIAPRRNGLVLLLTRTPFDLLLRGCTIAEVQAAMPAATVPRMFKLKLRDSMLILRKYHGSQPLNTGWAARAQMEESVDGVRLAGHLCYLSDRIYFAFFSIVAMLVLGVAAWFAINEGLGSAGFTGCLLVASPPALLALLVVATQPRGVAKNEETAKQMLRGIFENG